MKTSDYDSRKEEAELIARLHKRDTNALEHLYLRHVDRLYSLVFNQVGKNKRVAENILQDTFMTAINSIVKFHGEIGFYTWLCSIAEQKINNFYRRKAREVMHDVKPAISIDTEHQQIRDIETLTTDRVKAEETQQTIGQALSNLPLNYRQVLMFKYVEQMPIHEISHIMRRSPKSMEGLLARAQTAFQNNLSHATKR